MSKHFKFFGILFLAIAVFSFAAFPAHAAKTYKWKIAHTRSPEAQVHKDLVEFAQKVEDATEGRMKISVMSGGQLGSVEVAQERVAMGNFAMAMAPVATAIDKRFEITILPGLIPSWEKAAKNLVRGSEFINLLSSWSEEQNLTIVASYPFYIGGLAFTSVIDEPGNPELNRGLKVRIPPMVAFRHMNEGLGYIPTPITWTDVFPSLQTGVIDGVSGSGAEGYTTSGFTDVLKSYLPINTHFEVWFLLVNSEMWKDLPDDIRNVITDEAVKLQNTRLVKGPNEMKHWEQQMRDKGLVVFDLTDAEIAAYHKVIKDSCWEATREVVGAEAFDEAISKLK